MTEEQYAYRVHRFGGSYVCHGTPADMRRYVDTLNEGRTQNLWSAQPVLSLKPHHGICIDDELAKMTKEQTR